jgi:RNA polymerase sigma factor (sigma-70 family)
VTEPRTDEQLLAEWRSGSEQAFAELVRRYAPMVLGACRRLAGPAEAEDAAQAVFMVFARKAGSLHGASALGAWLYRTAALVAQTSRRRAAARARIEKEAAAMRPQNSVTGVDVEQLRGTLDRLLIGLPRDEREAVILCTLAGRTQREAGRELGCPEKTVQARVTRALERLRAALERQGWQPGISVAALGAAIGQASQAPVSEALLGSLVALGTQGATAGGTAAALAKGAMKVMFWMKVKLAVAVIGVALVVGGGSGAVVLKFTRWGGLAGGDRGKAGRIEIKLAHKGQVFGEGAAWDKQFAAEALQIFKDLKPDPAWVATLKALPDNTWLKCNPGGDHGDGPGGRSETPMVYMPDFHACIFHGGDGDPGFSSDTWIYHLGANRWVQMQPNFVKCGEAAQFNKGPWPGDRRPATRCSFGVAYDRDNQRFVVRGGSNNDGLVARITWEYDPATNRWEKTAPFTAGLERYEDNCLGFVPGFGVVEVGHGSTWVYRDRSWRTVATQPPGAPPGAANSKLVWASKQNQLIYWVGGWADGANRGSLWAFDPKALAWTDISPKEGPNPTGFYRQGMDYDSANDVVIMYGTKDESGKMSQGPWVYSFEQKTWTDMKPAYGPPKGSGQCLMTAYDPEYNVLTIACNGRGAWVYRYKQAKQ